MPQPIPPRLSPDDEAALDAALEDPVFQLYADTFMDMEFCGEGLSEAVLELEPRRYLLQVQIVLHNAAISLLEPGESYVQAYRIARERAADRWQRHVLLMALLRRAPESLSYPKAS
ncbi:MAG: hypothetical protein ABI690_13660 [Chloroflexota bacterium]